MSRVIAAILMLAMFAGAQSLPDAPSSTKRPIKVVVLSQADFDRVVEPEHVSHRGRTIALIAIVGGLLTTGLIIGLLKHSGNCPKMIWYEGKGYPYSGTYDDQHKCPVEPPGLDEPRKR